MTALASVTISTTLRRLVTSIASVGLGLALLSGLGATAGASTSGSATGPSNLTKALSAIESSSRYRQSDWGYAVLDAKSGKVLAAQNDHKMFDPGSTAKTYAAATALKLYGPNYRFKTPVYREGTLSGTTLHGNVVLVASGDLTFGLRTQAGDTLYYENLPTINHSYATLGVPGAVVPPGNPLGALDQLAAKVRAAGITQVNGNVVIDDRLFTPFDGWPDGLISPIWVNENLIDVQVKPGAVGQPASVSWEPMTGSYTLANQVTTVSAKKKSSMEVTEPTPGHLVVVGQIAAASKPTLLVHQIDDPAAFARTAFIEALQRAGVTVTAAATGPNPAALLPPKGSYQPGDMLGEHVSLPLSQYVNLIMKVSYNRGADLLACLAAVKTGSTDCEQGIVAEFKTLTDFGLSPTSAYLIDGAGSSDQTRITPAGLASFLVHTAKTSYGTTLSKSLPVLGRSGSLANVLAKSSVAGHAQLKTGGRIVGTPAEQIILLGNSLAGYIQTKSGKHVTVMIAVGNVPISGVLDSTRVTKDQAKMVEAISQDL